MCLPPARSAKSGIAITQAPKSGLSPYRGGSLHRFWQNLAQPCQIFQKSVPSVHSTVPNFAKNWCMGGRKPPKTENFYEILEYKRPAGAFPLLDFYKTFSVYAECFLLLVFKIWSN